MPSISSTVSMQISEYALATLRAAEQAGADTIVLCDTNGGTLTEEIRDRMLSVSHHIKTPLGIHTHNDSDMAVANAMIAIRHGAVHVQGTINGYGERCGNANLCSIIPNIELKLGMQAIGKEKLSQLTEVSRYVSEIANLTTVKTYHLWGRARLLTREEFMSAP